MIPSLFPHESLMIPSWFPHILLLFLAVMLWWNAINTPHLRRDRSAGTCRRPPLKRRDVPGLPLDWSTHLSPFLFPVLFWSLITLLASGAFTSGPGVSPSPWDRPALPDGPHTWCSSSLCLPCPVTGRQGFCQRERSQVSYFIVVG